MIGSFLLRSDDHLLLDLLLVRRANTGHPFFDKHIPCIAARITEAEVANKLYTIP